MNRNTRATLGALAIAALAAAAASADFTLDSKPAASEPLADGNYVLCTQSGVVKKCSVVSIRTASGALAGSELTTPYVSGDDSTNPSFTWQADKNDPDSPACFGWTDQGGDEEEIECSVADQGAGTDPGIEFGLKLDQYYLLLREDSDVFGVDRDSVGNHKFSVNGLGAGTFVGSVTATKFKGNVDLGDSGVVTGAGTAARCARFDASHHLIEAGADCADVNGPGSSTDNALARFDGTSGKLIQNSSTALGDGGTLKLAGDLCPSSVAGTVCLAMTGGRLYEDLNGDEDQDAGENSLGIATGTIGVNSSGSVSTIANTNSNTQFGNSCSIPSDVAAGDVLRIYARGVYSTDSSPPTIRIRGYIGSTVVLDTGTISTLVGSVSNLGWSVEGQVIVNSVGGGGAVEAQGTAQLATPATTALPIFMPNTSTVSVNASNASLGLKVQWGTASASNTITQRQMVCDLVEVR